MLLGLDPFIGNSAYVPNGNRFTDPTSIGGGQTGPKGEILTVIHEITVTDTETTNTVNTLVTDYKPSSWNAVFGSNQSTENQLTLTYGSVNQTVSDQKQTCSLTYFVGAGDPPFLTGYSYDTWLGGLAFYPWRGGKMPVGS